MDTTILIRVIAGVLFAVILVVVWVFIAK